MNFNLLKVVRAALPLMVLMLSACLGGGGGSPAPAVTTTTGTTTTTGYTIGGAVSGLSGSVVLQDNGGDNFTVATAGNFTFASKVNNNTQYAVTVLTQPSGQTCSVSTGAGTVSGGNVTNVAVTCSTNAYTVGGTVSGLTGSVVLQDNSGDNLSVSANGAYTFATKVANGSPYSVTVLTQPTGKTCSIANGTGTIALANISNVAITCATATHTVGGTVSGLNGSMVLQDNGADNSTVSVNGPFNFPTAVAYGSPYSVSILSKPAAQHCGVTSGAGTIATSNISGVNVACANNQMGGAMQLGAALNLNTVSTFAGSATPVSYTDGTGAGAGFSSPSSSVSVGLNLYVADQNNNAIRKIVIATGVVTTLAGSPTGVAGAVDGTGTAATFWNPSGITTDGTNLYVADQNNNSIRKIVIATGVVSTLAGSPTGAFGVADGTGAAATFNAPASITYDAGTASLYVGDLVNNKIRKIVAATGAVTSFTGPANAAASWGLMGATVAQDGAGAVAVFNIPYGITTDGTNLYVADQMNNKIRQIVIATQVVSSLTGTANTQMPAGQVDGGAAAARFSKLGGITYDAVTASLYVTDTLGNKIRRISLPIAPAISSFTGTAGGPGAADGAAAAATFNSPVGITASGGNLYVVDQGNNKIRQIVIGTGTVTSLAGGLTAGANGTGVAARFSSPTGVTTDGTNLYVADQMNHTIRKIVIATGVTTTLAGQEGVIGAANGTGTAATFNSPYGITTDGTNLYVADNGNNVIRKIVIATGVVSTFAGSGVAASTDGTGIAATFNSPNGITTDGTFLYEVEAVPCTLRKIEIATQVVTTMVPASCGNADGIGAAAKFSNPLGITTDGPNLYVVDGNTRSIRKVVIATNTVSTLAGAPAAPAAGSGSFGATDATGTAARFNYPTDITTDGTNLYVADQFNNKIRKIVIATGVVTSLTGAANTSVVAGTADGAAAAASFNSPVGITSDGVNLYVTDSGSTTIRKIQ